MRYTEARLAKITEEILADLEKETVDFIPNFDQDAGRACRAAIKNAESADQWRQRHRRRHGDEYSAAQSGRNHRCHCHAHRKAGHNPQRNYENCAGAGLLRTAGYISVGSEGHRQRVQDGLRAASSMRAKAAIENLRQGPREHRHHRNSVPGQQVTPHRAHRRAGAKQKNRRHLRRPRRI